jgi:hypothetical protein
LRAFEPAGEILSAAKDLPFTERLSNCRIFGLTNLKFKIRQSANPVNPSILQSVNSKIVNPLKIPHFRLMRPPAIDDV